MKKMLHSLKKYFLLAIGLVLLSGNVAKAQTEITVDEGFNTLLTAVNENPGATIILKRGGEYVIDQTVEITMPTIIKGETEPADQRPALVRFYGDPGTAHDKYHFATAVDLTLQDYGMVGWTSNKEWIKGFIDIKAPGLKIIIEGCVIQGGFYWQVWNPVDSHIDFTFRNNIQFNTGHENLDDHGGYGGLLWGGDSCDFKAYNNTYFVAQRIFGNSGSGPFGTQYMDHNSYVNTWGDVFFTVDDKDFILKNSILFNAHLRAWKGLTIEGSDTLYVGEGAGPGGNFEINLHTMDTLDGPRNITVTNNLKWSEQRVFDFNAAEGLTMQPFYNATTDSLGQAHGWTIENNWLQADGNGYDPKFAMGAIPEGCFTQMFKQAVERRLAPDQQTPGFPHELSWWFDDLDGTARDFIWPLPFDLTPTDRTTWDAGDDGFPLGDLNWFGPDVVDAWEAGEDCPDLTVSAQNIEIEDLNLINYPNPFSSVTQIRYNLSANSHVIIKIYDVAGAEVATLVNEAQFAGQQEIMFDGATLSGGVYFCKIKAGNLLQVNKMTLIK